MRWLQKVSFPSQDVTSSMVVFFVALPLCLALSIASGAPPAAGLMSGMIGGVIVGMLSGSPLMVSGPSAGMIVVAWETIQLYGLSGLGASVIIAGILQVMGGLLGVGRWFQAVTEAVVKGMLTSIGLLIILGQLHVIFDLKPEGGGLDNIQSLFSLAVGGHASSAINMEAATIGILATAVVWLWSSYAPPRLKSIPGALVVVIGLTALALVLELEILRVNVPSSLVKSVSFDGIKTLLTTFEPGVFAAGVTIALLASTECMLTVGAMARLAPSARPYYDRELIAQGIGNMTAGAVGALPLTGVIVRSAANITAGAQSRLSTMLHGVWLLGLTLIFPQLLGLVPLSVLAGILLFFGFRLLNPQGAAALVKENRAEAAIFFLTIAAIIATDLLTGILIGFVLSLLHLFFGVTKASVSTVEHDDLVKLRLGGVVTFLAGPKLTEVLERIDQKRPLEFDTEGLIYIDQATLARLRDWVASYVARGGEASVSWHTLERRQNLLVRE